MIDAAGAIYVIGGTTYDGNTFTFYHDVWKSTDGGVHWTCTGRSGGTGLVGSTGVLGCTRWLSKGTRNDTQGVI